MSANTIVMRQLEEPFKVMLTGALGQLGKALILLKPDHIKLYAFSRQELDITDVAQVKKMVLQVNPQLIINAAAYNQVDEAQRCSELAYAVNQQGVLHLVDAACRLEVPLIHVSSDYVFDGQKQQLYIEADEPCPINAYGKSKLAGEREFLKTDVAGCIVRTSSVFGGDVNFISRLIQKARTETEIKVVQDLISTPTAAGDLAKLLWIVIDDYWRKGFFRFPKDQRILHYAGVPPVSRYQWAQEILDYAKQKKLLADLVRMQSCLQKDFAGAALRPFYAGLNSGLIQQLYGVKPSDWLLATKAQIDLCYSSNIK